MIEVLRAALGRGLSALAAMEVGQPPRGDGAEPAAERSSRLIGAELVDLLRQIAEDFLGDVAGVFAFEVFAAALAKHQRPVKMDGFLPRVGLTGLQPLDERHRGRRQTVDDVIPMIHNLLQYQSGCVGTTISRCLAR